MGPTPSTNGVPGSLGLLGKRWIERNLPFVKYIYICSIAHPMNIPSDFRPETLSLGRLREWQGNERKGTAGNGGVLVDRGHI